MSTPARGPTRIGATPDTAILYARDVAPSPLATSPLYVTGEAEAALAASGPSTSPPGEPGGHRRDRGRARGAAVSRGRGHDDHLGAPGRASDAAHPRVHSAARHHDRGLGLPCPHPGVARASVRERVALAAAPGSPRADQHHAGPYRVPIARLAAAQAAVKKLMEKAYTTA